MSTTTPAREVDPLAHARVLAEVGDLYDAEAEVAEILDDHPEDKNALDLSGCVAVVLCRTTTWTRVN